MSDQSFDPMLQRWETSVPEPFWIRSSWFRWRPACYECRITFKTRDDYTYHWLKTPHTGLTP